MGNRLYLHIAGTGMLYESDTTSVRDSLSLKRIDVTQLQGYNYASYVFPYRGRIYNFGGYGFWHRNGQLRAFNNKIREWEIMPLDKEVALSIWDPECFVWYDIRRERIFLLRAVQGNEAVKGEAIRLDDEVRVLDLSKRKWQTLGIQSLHCKERMKACRLVAASDSGLLVIQTNQLQYWLPAENRILSLVDYSPLAEVSSRMEGTHSWMQGGMLYYGSAERGFVDSLPLHTGMFRDSGERIYEVPPLVSWNALLLPFIGVVLVFAIGGISVRIVIHKPIVAETSIEHPKVMQSVEVVPAVNTIRPTVGVVFDQVEGALLSLLIQNESDGDRRTTSQEVNRILGVGNKSMDIQKRKRSDVIRSINRKYLLVKPDRKTEPIVKNRSDIDARLSEYSIHPDELPWVAALLEGHSQM